MKKNKFKPCKWDLFKNLEQEAIDQMIVDGHDCECQECLCCMAKMWMKKESLCSSCEYEKYMPTCVDDSFVINEKTNVIVSCQFYKIA